MADSERLGELLRRFEENPRRYFVPLANEYRLSGDPHRALSLCRAHLPDQPGHLSGYIVYGQALTDTGAYTEATAIFEEALRIDPENLVALRALGDLARQQGDRVSALHWYERLSALDPENEEIEPYVAELIEPDADVPEGDVAEAMEAGLEVEEPEGPEQDIPVPDIVGEETAEPASLVPESVAPNMTDPEFADDPEVFPAFDEEPAPSAPPTPVVPSPFVTETMAELYLQQGFVNEALAVYRQLAAQRDEPRFHAKVRELEGGAPVDAEVQPEAEVTPSAEPVDAGVPEISEPDATTPDDGITDVSIIQSSEWEIVGEVAELAENVPAEVQDVPTEEVWVEHVTETVVFSDDITETVPDVPVSMPPVLTVRDFFARIGARRPGDAADVRAQDS